MTSCTTTTPRSRSSCSGRLSSSPRATSTPRSTSRPSKLKTLMTKPSTTKSGLCLIDSIPYLSSRYCKNNQLSQIFLKVYCFKTRMNIFFRASKSSCCWKLKHKPFKPQLGNQTKDQSFEPSAHVEVNVDPAAGSPVGLLPAVLESGIHLHRGGEVDDAQYIGTVVTITGASVGIVATFVSRRCCDVYCIQLEDPPPGIFIVFDTVFEDSVSLESAGADLQLLGPVLIYLRVVGMVGPEHRLLHGEPGLEFLLGARVHKNSVSLPLIVVLEECCVVPHCFHHHSWVVCDQVTGTGYHMIHTQSIVGGLPNLPSFPQVGGMHHNIAQPESPLETHLGSPHAVDACFVDCEACLGHPGERTHYAGETQCQVRDRVVYFPDEHCLVLIGASVGLPVKVSHRGEPAPLGPVAPDGEKRAVDFLPVQKALNQLHAIEDLGLYDVQERLVLEDQITSHKLIEQSVDDVSAEIPRIRGNNQSLLEHHFQVFNGMLLGTSILESFELLLEFPGDLLADELVILPGEELLEQDDLPLRAELSREERVVGLDYFGAQQGSVGVTHFVVAPHQLHQLDRALVIQLSALHLVQL